jgi:DNA polymerase
MFIGEGPGAREDEQGRPFVGASGKFLDQLLEQAGVTRADVWITNVVKCRPPGNRDPLPDEIEICTSNYLQHQIKLVDPSIIVTLGRFSMGLFFKGAKITQIHGQMRKVEDRFVIPMYHPAAALHQLSLKSTIMADFAKLPELLKEARAELGKSAPKGKTIKKKTNRSK